MSIAETLSIVFVTLLQLMVTLYFGGKKYFSCKMNDFKEKIYSQNIHFFPYCTTFFPNSFTTLSLYSLDFFLIIL